MIRALYRCLLHLHPRRFRQRFAGEMLWIFDQAAESRGAVPLLADAGLSLCRQWIFRSEFHQEPSSGAAGPPSVPTAPAFYLCASDLPRPGPMLHGIILSVGVFAAFSFLMGHGGRYRAFLLGSHHPGHSHLLPVPASAIPERELSAEVKVKPDSALQAHDPLRRFISGYFRQILVLSVLDTNHDLTLSAAEIANAARLLPRLDTNGDGKLTVEECARYVGQLTRAHPAGFMRLHPVLNALDADHDGTISWRELQDEPAALKHLDRNYNGALEPAEILPEPAAFQSYMFLSRLDKNGDGVISKRERTGALGEMLADVLNRADRNHDGIVTERELTDEIRRSADLNGDGVVTWEEMLIVLKSRTLLSTAPPPH